MKLKQDKLFKKGEALVERFCRLRGNLFFYFKGKDAKSEPAGLLVMERCAVELDLNEQAHFSFVIVYEGDEQTYTFSAATEEERDSWIQVLHVASYECLKMQLQSLREQVQAKTGKDPLSQALPSDTGMDYETGSAQSTEDPAMEMSLSISGLPNDSNGQPPNPFVVVYIIIPPQQQTWLQHNHTEMVEKNNNPLFLKTIGFGDANGLEPCTRVKVTVYNVKERMTGTMSQIGQKIFTLNDIMTSTDMKLNMVLAGADSSRVGELSVVAWMNDANPSIVDIQGDTALLAVDQQRNSAFPQRRSKRLDTLRPLCENITSRTYRFDTNKGVKLLVYEYMAESKLTFDVPIKLLKLYIEEEKTRVTQLQDLGKLPALLESHVAADINFRAATVSDYTDAINLLACHQGLPHTVKHGRSPSKYMECCMTGDYTSSSFKPSTKKGDKEMEFVPVNLHLQRMSVVNESTNECGCYDIVTVGAFTALTRKTRSGGLWKMIQQLQEQYTPEGTLSKVTKVKRACDLVNNLYSLQSDIQKLCGVVCHEALQGDGVSLQKATDRLADKVKDLVQDCESPILQETANKLADIHEEFEALEEEAAKQGLTTGQKALLPNDKSPDKQWKWTGSCFVKSPTVEPWDMTRVNTEAALVCLTSMVEDLIRNKSGAMDRPKWLGDISPAVIKLKSFVEIVCQKANHFMSFLDLMEHKDNLKSMHTVKCRRDVVFSHALTSLVSGLVCHVNAHIDDHSILNQLATLGVVAQFEGLLSCHGDEMPMLEDMIVAVDDLATVSFTFFSETPQNKDINLTTNELKRAGLYPDLNRHHVCVEVPLKKAVFDQLPTRLQNGEAISVTPVFFNIGINEQATLGEKFGNTTLQDKTNEASLGKFNKYVKQYEDMPDFPDKTHQPDVHSISHLLQLLSNNVYIKKSKNVEVLHLAAELCRRVHGIRFTCCKSAKDRTAMAVTLEQVQILQREHDLASHVFNQSLDCFRSEGVRRENAYKNVGQRKYAFNSLQLLSFPKLYRPPHGTYGNVQN